MPANQGSYAATTDSRLASSRQPAPAIVNSLRAEAQAQLAQGGAALLMGAGRPVYADEQLRASMSNRHALEFSTAEGDRRLRLSVLRKVAIEGSVHGDDAAEEFAGQLLQVLRAEWPKAFEKQVQEDVDSIDISGIAGLDRIAVSKALRLKAISLNAGAGYGQILKTLFCPPGTDVDSLEEAPRSVLQAYALIEVYSGSKAGERFANLILNKIAA